MPYTLVDPKPRRSPFYRVRGTEFGEYLNRSTKTASKREAQRFLAAWRDEAQRRSLSGPVREVTTFASAALAYIQANGETRFLRPLVEHFGEKPLADIDQGAIDGSAVTLYPAATSATRNRQVYSPVSAVMKRAGFEKAIKRPKGWRSAPRPHWLRPEQAFALLEAASAENERFGALLAFLLYTGCRLSEALRLEWDEVDLPRAVARLRETKNGEALTVHLPAGIVALLANLGDGRSRRSVFGFSKSGRLYALLSASEKRAGISLPDRSAFHVLRHSHATWRRLYTGADTTALTQTGLWKSRQAAAVYEHVDATAEARKSDLLPTSTRAFSVRKTGK